jgi:hypothetical protein
MSFTTLGLRSARVARASSSLPLSRPSAARVTNIALRHYSSPSTPNQFSQPTNPALNTDEAKNRPGYEEYREEVEPKYANVDQSFVFDHPKVGPWALCLLPFNLSPLSFPPRLLDHRSVVSTLPHHVCNDQSCPTLHSSSIECEVVNPVSGQILFRPFDPSSPHQNDHPKTTSRC